MSLLSQAVESFSASTPRCRLRQTASPSRPRKPTPSLTKHGQRTAEPRWRRGPDQHFRNPELAGILIPGRQHWYKTIEYRGALPRDWKPVPPRIHNRADNVTDYFAPGCGNAWEAMHGKRLEAAEREVGRIEAGSRVQHQHWKPADMGYKDVHIVRDIKPWENVRARNCLKWAAEHPEQWSRVGGSDTDGDSDEGEEPQDDGFYVKGGRLMCDPKSEGDGGSEVSEL